MVLLHIQSPVKSVSLNLPILNRFGGKFGFPTKASIGASSRTCAITDSVIDSKAPPEAPFISGTLLTAEAVVGDKTEVMKEFFPMH
jgi:hypothetical protein